MLSAFLYLNNLVLQIFKCPSVKWLSMKYNYLDKIPADIGRMAALEYLALTNNKLQNKSLPHTLTFCNKLKALMLDNNLLDALPGFLIKMSSLKTVHRHGNHNYFKSTFMWYHTDVNERILAVSGTNDFMPREPETLQFWAAKSVIGLKLNFFADPAIATVLKNYISDIYTMFNVCGYCNTAKLVTQPGTLNYQYTCLMTHFHQRRRIQIQIPNPIVTLYYAQHFPLVRIQIQIPVRIVSQMVTVPILGTDLRLRDPNPNPSPLVEMSHYADIPQVSKCISGMGFCISNQSDISRVIVA